MAAEAGKFAHDDGCALGFEDGCGEQADGACAADKGDVTVLDSPGSFNSVVAYGERFNEGCFVEGDVLGDFVDPATFDGDLFSEAAAAPGEADEVHILGEVVVLVAGAGFYVVAYDVGFNDDVVAYL